MFLGLVTGVGTSMIIYIPMPKKLKNINNVTVTKFTYSGLRGNSVNYYLGDLKRYLKNTAFFKNQEQDYIILTFYNKDGFGLGNDCTVECDTGFSVGDYVATESDNGLYVTFN
jgi:hypothetical protein